MTDDKAGAPAVADQLNQVELLKAQLSAEQRRGADLALNSNLSKQAAEKGIGTSPSQPEHIMQFFAHAHLPAQLAAVSKPFGDLADQIVANLPRNPERTVALRKLLEAKDAAVRAFIAK